MAGLDTLPVLRHWLRLRLRARLSDPSVRGAGVMAFNRLDDAQAERLALLLEELGEAQQAIGKILRHGYAKGHPDGGSSNRMNLEKELGDVEHAIDRLHHAGDLDREKIAEWSGEKAELVERYLHHQGEA